MIDFARQPGYDPEMVRKFVAEGLWTDEVLGDWLRERAQNNGDDAAIIAGEQAISYATAYRQALRFANALLDAGFRKYDVVAIQLPNIPEFLTVYWGVALMGGVLSMIHMPYRKSEMEPLLRHGAAKAVVCGGAAAGYDAPATMLELCETLPELVTVIVATGEAPVGTLSLESMLRSADAREITDPPRAEDPLALGFTSGTSSAPKAILRDHRSMLANNRAVVPLFDVRPGDAVLSAPPFSHIFGLLCAGLILRAGAANVLMPSFSPPVFAQLIERNDVGVMFCAPAHIAATLNAGLHETADFSSLRTAYVAGSALSVELARAWESAMPAGKISQMFGMTETIMSMVVPHDDPPETRLHKIGRVIDGIEMRITAEDGSVRPADVEGELEIRGYTVFPGYYGNQAANREAFRDGGWFRTGDLGMLDETGHLVLTGRIKDIINRGAIKINPSEIETLVMGHPAVVDAAIVPVPDDVLGERACLCVTLVPGAALDLDDVISWLAKRGVAKLRWPERLEIMDDMPMTPTRKVIKGALARRIASQG
jgi:non-ribosomal peptide synthetase component E (peptide arylation enzyme)